MRPLAGVGRAAVGVCLLQQENLDGTAGGPAQPQPGREHPGVVDHHHIARLKQGVEIGDPQVLDPVAPVHQQPGSVPLSQGGLGYGRGRQVVVEVIGSLRRSAVGGPRGGGLVLRSRARGGRRRWGPGLGQPAIQRQSKKPDWTSGSGRGAVRPR